MCQIYDIKAGPRSAKLTIIYKLNFDNNMRIQLPILLTAAAAITIQGPDATPSSGAPEGTGGVDENSGLAIAMQLLYGSCAEMLVAIQAHIGFPLPEE